MSKPDVEALAGRFGTRFIVEEVPDKALSQAGADQVLWWHDIEVVLDAGGKPSLAFHGRGQAVFNKLQIKQSLLSLSHSDTEAGAVVILQKYRLLL